MPKLSYNQHNCSKFHPQYPNVQSPDRRTIPDKMKRSLDGERPFDAEQEREERDLDLDLDAERALGDLLGLLLLLRLRLGLRLRE